MLPGLVAHRLPTPKNVDWARVESELGVVLPADFRLLCELYPVFALSDFMYLGAPEPGAEVAWVQAAHENLEIIAEWCENADLDVPMYLYPAPGGLLPWGTSNQGDYFLWTTNPAGAQEWIVTVASRNGGWWHYTGGVIQFLADLVSGILEPWGLPTVRPEITWVKQ